MTTWFTADLHVGHRNIIAYCRRPFDDVESMNRALISNWNDLVADDDTVWVVGDVALGTIDDTLPLVSELKGHKILVAGNHDRCWFGHGARAAPWIDRYRAVGFDEIVQGYTRTEVAGIEVVVCHFPYRGDSHDDDRFIEHRPPDDGGWLIHGHVHDRWRREGRMINVGVDVRDLRPVSEPELAAEMRAETAR